MMMLMIVCAGFSDGGQLQFLIIAVSGNASRTDDVRRSRPHSSDVCSELAVATSTVSYH